MVYVKSTLVGFLTLFLSLILLVIVQMSSALTALKAAGLAGGMVGINVVSLAKSPSFWGVAIVGFGIGFWWEYRRATK